MNPVAGVAFVVLLASFVVGGVPYAFVVCRDLGVSYWDSIDTFGVLKEYRKAHPDDPRAVFVHHVTLAAMIVLYVSVAVLFVATLIGGG